MSLYITIFTTNNDKTFNFDIHLDPYGNVYLDGSNYIDDPYFTESKLLLFQLNVDRNDKLYADSGNYDIIDMNAIINKQKMDGELRYNDDNIGDNIDDHIDTHIDDPVEINEDYIIEMGSDDNEILCDDNPQFIFHYVNDDIQINERENGDIAALYDTNIYDSNGMLKLKTVSGDNSSIYKLRIHLNGVVYFKCITHIENKYKPVINNLGELQFISIS
jgi:hypothetical protein